MSLIPVQTSLTKLAFVQRDCHKSMKWDSKWQQRTCGDSIQFKAFSNTESEHAEMLLEFQEGNRQLGNKQAF